MVSLRAKQVMNSIKPNLTKAPPGPTQKGSAGYDNVRDDIEKVKHIRELRLANLPHVYGGFQDVDYTLPLGADTWTNITNLTNDLWVGIEANGMTLTADQMIILNQADYFGTITLTFSALNGKDFQIRLRNITQNKTMGYDIGASTTGVTNFTNITLPIYAEANTGDVLEMQMKCTTDGTDPILRSAVFYMSYLHE